MNFSFQKHSHFKVQVLTNIQMTTSWTPPNVPAVQQEFVPALRLRAIDLLCTRLPATAKKRFDTARDIEEQIHNICLFQNIDYGAKVLQLAWNLHTNGEHLLKKHGPSALVMLDDVTLAEGTEVEAWWKAHEDRLESQRQLLFNEAKFEEEEQPKHSELICNRCLSRSIAIQQQQTRSADEGMTVFCTCKKCGMRWKMY